MCSVLAAVVPCQPPSAQESVPAQAQECGSNWGISSRWVLRSRLALTLAAHLPRKVLALCATSHRAAVLKVHVAGLLPVMMLIDLVMLHAGLRQLCLVRLCVVLQKAWAVWTYEYALAVLAEALVAAAKAFWVVVAHLEQAVGLEVAKLWKHLLACTEAPLADPPGVVLVVAPAVARVVARVVALMALGLARLSRQVACRVVVAPAAVAGLVQSQVATLTVADNRAVAESILAVDMQVHVAAAGSSGERVASSRQSACLHLAAAWALL